MKIVVTGSTGLIGSALIPALAGNEIVRLRRGMHWDPEHGILDPEVLRGAEAVIHLAAENLDRARWTPRQMAKIRESRVRGTGAVARAIAALAERPRVLVSASAVGYYGDRGDEVLDETSGPGTGFLAEVCRAWEEAAAPAAEAGVRVVRMRFGVVLSAHGGALARMLPPFRLGAGGPVGHGRQWVSWITLDDAVAAIRHVLADESLSGPVNAVSPNPVRNRDFVRALGRAVGRPAVIPAPAFALRLVFGRVVDEVLLPSQRAVPRRLEQAGFAFRHASIAEALQAVLSTSTAPGSAA